MRHASLIMLMFVFFSIQPALTWMVAAPVRQETAIPNVFISSPTGGQALQGVIAIRGNTAVANFQSTSLSFAYQDDVTGTWFLIHESNSPVAYDVIAQWDTTTISDGNYNLRLTVRLTDGNSINVIIEGLRVRNYSPIETDTATPPAPSATSQTTLAAQTSMVAEAASPTMTATTTATATVTPLPPTITPLPTNPFEFSQATMINTLGKGGLVALGLFILLGSYLAGRTFFNRMHKTPKS